MRNYITRIGLFPIINSYRYNMDYKYLVKDYNNAPFTRQVILDMLKDYKRPNDKISELIKSRELISLKKELYIPGKK